MDSSALLPGKALVRRLRARPRQQYIRDAQAFLLANRARPGLEVREAAQALHLSESYLCRLFRQETGETPGACLTRYRMELALELLLTTRAPVWQVAQDCGYRDMEAFYRNFRAHTGSTPDAYRKANRNDP